MNKRGKVIVLLTGLLAAGIIVGYVFKTVQKQVSIPEPLTYTETATPAATLYPGQTTWWNFTVANAAGAPTYGVKVTMYHNLTSPTSSLTLYGVTNNTKTSLAGGATLTIGTKISAGYEEPGQIVASVTLAVDRAAP